MSKLNLSDVTLITASSILIPETVTALQKSCEGINFAEVVLVSHELPSNLPSNITFKQCDKLNCIDDYNRFCFYELHKYFNTTHSLTVQHDGWVLNPHLWSDEFIKYDWCGAPWAYDKSDYRAHDGSPSPVGNGGVAIKSKKILELPTKYDLPMKELHGWLNEDGQYCNYWKPLFLDLGITYAPAEVAARFSFETNVPENKDIKEFFAYHKNYPQR